MLTLASHGELPDELSEYPILDMALQRVGVRAYPSTPGVASRELSKLVLELEQAYLRINNLDPHAVYHGR